MLLIQVLGDFSQRRDPETSRSQYLGQLRQDFCSYYGYNEFLMEKLMDLFPQDIMEFLEANEVDRPVSATLSLCSPTVVCPAYHEMIPWLLLYVHAVAIWVTAKRSNAM